MMFTATNLHSEYSIRLLSKTQYNIFGLGKQLGTFLMGLTCFAISIFVNVGETNKFILLALGGWLIVSINLPQTRQADKLVAALDGNYPKSEFLFDKNFISVISNNVERKYTYNQVICIASDDEYYYFFISIMSAYMISKKAICPNDSSNFLTMLEHKTGLHIIRPNPLFKLNIREIYWRIYNIRMLRKRSKT